MQVTFGKHHGKYLTTLILKEPNYVKWVLEQTAAAGPLAQVKAEVERLVSIFDDKPITQGCYGRNCNKQAVKFSAYVGSPSPLCTWYDSCNPYHRGALDGKLVELKTYRKALQHVALTCGERKGRYRAIIKSIALAKGLPKRSRQQHIHAFFA
jgi:hypothetical protein